MLKKSNKTVEKVKKKLNRLRQSKVLRTHKLWTTTVFILAFKLFENIINFPFVTQIKEQRAQINTSQRLNARYWL